MSATSRRRKHWFISCGSCNIAGNLHLLFIIFFFALGACVGSFLNVVVWRLPRNESIVSPPSHCPKCGTRLAWYDNIPVFGWLALGGKCRYCKQPISIRYPIIEAITGGLFVFYYVALFIWQIGPCAVRPMSIQQDWPIYILYMLTISGLLASSLIDAEHFIIPIEIPWIIAFIAFVVHAFIGMPFNPGSLAANAPVGAMALGAGIGLIISIILLRKKFLPQSFADGGPPLEIEKEAIEKAKAKGEAVEYEPPEFTRAQIRVEMGKEMLFLMPPLVLGGAFVLLTWKVPALARMWESMIAADWFAGFLGSLWGGLVGAFVIWFTRIAGSIVFGREAMGMGDVHLMLGIGAVIGAAGSVFVFFFAPFIGLLFAVYKLIFGRGRELPYGPFLSVATGVVILFYCRIIEYFSPSMQNLFDVLQQKFSG
jgi:leader peptidase (prepilin peptidase)/N-methyltransferase